MAKYVIDFDNCPFKVKTLLAMGWKEEDGLERFKTIGDDEVELLDADYINENYGDLQDIAYQAGLEDAWELMHKIAFYNDPHVLIDAFGATTLGEILNNNTPHEALAKLQAYEQKQKEDAEIVEGDAVKSGKHVGIVTRTHKEGRSAWVTWDDGTSGVTSIEVLTKTGKHYDIAALLEKMKGE